LFGRGNFDPTRAVGVLEILASDGRWGMVCDTKTEEQAKINAQLLCRELFAFNDVDASRALIPVPQ